MSDAEMLQLSSLLKFCWNEEYISSLIGIHIGNVCLGKTILSPPLASENHKILR